MDKATWVFILLGRAREEVKKNLLPEALPLYLEALEMALSIPHPTGILNSLNDLAWYLKEEDPVYALSLAKKASYYLGYYREDVENHLEVIHTLWEIQRITQDLQLCDTAIILNFLDKKLSRSQKRNFKECYLKMFQTCKTLNLNLETSFYENSNDLRTYLKKHILSLSNASRVSGISRSKLTNILKGKVKHIRGNTLQRLIKHLNLKIDPLTTPWPLIQEAKKLKIEAKLKDNLSSLKSLSPSVRIVLFISKTL
ncbi:helix-turn-helix domain-containing protein [Candidatus Hakubella thermalkaliphila]|uniref:helix-turn-helix domain-containing protein n=1 Tax=Candidatus Hakubella thermalkaliphila TaxID=2754717 RepID=UPI001594107E|nr:helix-turn-helix transcriptional regulator [Candidatus Hakubella thermalkaliphila]